MQEANYFESLSLIDLPDTAEEFSRGSVGTRVDEDPGLSAEPVRTSVRCLLSIVEKIDRNTYRHMNRVSIIAESITLEMGEEDSLPLVRMSGLMHDIGKLCVPFGLLGKSDRLSMNEMELLKDHVKHGCEILENIDFPWPVMEVVMQHHERIDGSGYPEGLLEEDIRLESRILAVADAIDAMSYQRPWRPGMGIGHSLQKLLAEGAEGFDGAVIEACGRVFSNRGTGIRERLRHLSD